ncbi:hypothetical protein [Endozoicomonas numazuensis]|uniref:Uncharacterized protein n=1 Tax=Endozoicomonas numazuensis TaxID=1137799 RepID=A0A081NCX9_9GAMM|nr:hypothetical protein [Endozoicomonas numazuensis]KEQ16302.1 hypothetical protein GZ78_24185 [Endozoicomonas numazuensis]
MRSDDDEPVFSPIEAEQNLEILSDSLEHGQNWENRVKSMTAAKILRHSRYSFEQLRIKFESPSISSVVSFSQTIDQTELK